MLLLLGLLRLATSDDEHCLTESQYSIPRPEELGLNLPESFFSEFFERHWVLLRANSNSKTIFRSLWGLKDVLNTARSQGYRAYANASQRPSAEPNNSPSDADAAVTARAAIRHNITVVQDHVQNSHPPLANYLRQVTAYFGLPASINSYTTRNGMGFGHHFDTDDEFILQVNGAKTWEICKRHLPVLGVARGTTINETSVYGQLPVWHPDVQRCEKRELHEGDALYLPMGQIHRARAQEKLSVHLTMSLRRDILTGSFLLVEVAKQVDPALQFDDARNAFGAWLHRTVADSGGALKDFLNVPRTFLYDVKNKAAFGCTANRGFLDPAIVGISSLQKQLWLQPFSRLSKEFVQSYVDELKSTIATLRAHNTVSSDDLQVIPGTRSARSGNFLPQHVLDRILPLVTHAPCRRALTSYRHIFKRVYAKYDDVIHTASPEKIKAALHEDHDRREPVDTIKPGKLMAYTETQQISPLHVLSIDFDVR